MKKFSLAGRILRRPITVIMLTLVIIGFGVFSLSNLKVTLYPSLNIPVLAIQTTYGSVAPKDMQNLVVEPIEGAVSSVQGIETLDSNISKGSAFIILRLQSGTDIRRTELKVREEMSRIRNELPEEASEPIIFQFDPEQFPIMRLSLRADNKGLDELRQLGIDFIEPRIERLPGVASADTRGGLERKVFVNVKPMSLAQYNLVPSDIESALRSNNVQVPVGDIRTGTHSYSIRAQSMYKNVDQIRQTIITTKEGVPIRLRDVANVKDSFAKIETLVEINGKNSVSIEVQKKSDANTLDVTGAVTAQLNTINANLPEGAKLEVLTNDGENIENSISNLTQSALAALVVVIAVLLIFLGGWRISLVVASSIPVSVTASFAAMYAAGLTLNILTITALALAIGLLVDNGIVVSESIARKLEEGLPKMQAALEGTNEVIGALLGATLTTLGVFVPIISLSGVQGQFFSQFAVTISISVGFSFIASIILVPVLSLLFLKSDSFADRKSSRPLLHKLESGYVKSLRWLLFHKWVSLLFVGFILSGSYMLWQTLDTDFVPESDSGSVTMEITLPSGTKLVKTARIMRSYSNLINQKEGVNTVITKIGQSGYSRSTNKGRITVNLIEADERDFSTKEFSADLRQELKSPGVDLNIFGSSGGGFSGSGGSIRLSIIGPDIEVLRAVSNKIEKTLLKDKKVISVDNGRTDPTPELQYHVNRQRISRMGSSLNEVATSLKSQVQGSRAGELRQGGKEVPIEVRASKKTLTSREQLFDLELIKADSQRVPVTALGTFESTEGVDSITRRDRETLLDINVEVAGNAFKYRDKITDIIKQQIVLPEDYRYEFTGGTQSTQEGTSEVMWSLLFAVLLTYMIMASLFENFRDPLIIWFSIPLAMFGALFGLWIMQTALAVTAYIGMFMLVGVIVNNGIVLVDYMHLYAKNNEHSDSMFNNVLEACKRRLRPILLTALTTICSMIPLALGIGTGSEIWSPLARAVIGGLFFGSILTLYIIPAFIMGISKDRREAITKHKKQIS